MRPTPPGPVVELGIEREQIPVPAHAAYFWEADREFADAIGFLEVGLRGPDHCVILGHEEANRAALEVLREHGFDAEALQATARLSVLGASPTGEVMLRTIAATVERVIAGGAPLVRLLANVGWRRDGWPDEEELLAFEARLTPATEQFPCVVVCMYDAATLPARIVRHGAFETHSFIVPRREVGRNPYFIPTGLFLSRLETLSGEVLERRRAEQELRPPETLARTARGTEDLEAAPTQATSRRESARLAPLVEARTAELRRPGERQRVLLEINNAIISSLTREALFHAIARALHRALPFDRTAIFLHDPEQDVLKLFMLEASLPSTYFAVGLQMAAGESHVGWVFRNRRPLLRRDLEQERQYPMEERALADGVRSYVIVPLVARGTVVGTLAVASTTPDRYSESDAAFLQEVAGQIALAVENMKAYEEIAALKARLERENSYLQEEIRREHNFVEMVGGSPALLAVLRKVEQVGPTDSTVLISGETGTGKELIARAIHGRSARRGRPLVKVNCSAISAGLVESELFGHVKGAFTGALERRVGRFELADGGTIFLDEIGDLPLDTQVKLLRVLQEQEFEPVGSSKTMRVDVRIIAATNRDLLDAVEGGRFRADLFYRLNVFPIEVPPLRDRRPDIPQLVRFYLARFSQRFGKKVNTVSAETMDRLIDYAWPGNIRELQNVIERATVLTGGSVLEVDLGLTPNRDDSRRPSDAALAGASSELISLEEVERRHLLAVLNQTGWVIEGARGAARILKLHPNTLRSRLEKLGIRRPDHDIS